MLKQFLSVCVSVSFFIRRRHFCTHIFLRSFVTSFRSNAVFNIFRCKVYSYYGFFIFVYSFAFFRFSFYTQTITAGTVLQSGYKNKSASKYGFEFHFYLMSNIVADVRSSVTVTICKNSLSFQCLLNYYYYV